MNVPLGTLRGTTLLVEDEPLVRQVLARMLNEFGFMVVEAAGGEEALQASERMNGDVTLVVTDIHMPGMNGIEFARAVSIRHPGLPILFITGGESYGPVVLPADLNGDLLWKPFGPDSFLVKVNRLLARGAHVQPHSA
jgi:DNA-binding response OmpR family regulator